jgi:hypothetical protein
MLPYYYYQIKDFIFPLIIIVYDYHRNLRIVNYLLKFYFLIRRIMNLFKMDYLTIHLEIYFH